MVSFLKRVSNNVDDSPYSGLLGGLVQARMFQGSLKTGGFNTASGSQDFQLRLRPGSLGQVLQSKAGGQLTIFNGSSYACYAMLELLTGLKTGRKQKLLKAGVMPISLGQ